MSKKTLAPSIVTARDEKGVKFMSIVEAAYNKSRLYDEDAQRVNDAPGLAELIGRFIAENRQTNRFKDEEVGSNYTYPPEYRGPKPVEEQIEMHAKIFNLDPAAAFKYAKQLPVLESFIPKDHLPWVGWFAVLGNEAVRKFFPKLANSRQLYCNGTNLVLEKIAATRVFHNWREGEIIPSQYRITARTRRAIATLEEQQKSDILIVAAQLGMGHRGKSVRRAREVFAANEFGLGAIMGGSVTLTHPERFVRWKQLHMDLPGDEFNAPNPSARFGHAPILLYGGSGVGFAARRFGYASGNCGSASAFLPQIETGVLDS